MLPSTNLQITIVTRDYWWQKQEVRLPWSEESVQGWASPEMGAHDQSARDKGVGAEDLLLPHRWWWETVGWRLKEGWASWDTSQAVAIGANYEEIAVFESRSPNETRLVAQESSDQDWLQRSCRSQPFSWRRDSKRCSTFKLEVARRWLLARLQWATPQLLWQHNFLRCSNCSRLITQKAKQRQRCLKLAFAID